MHLKLTAEMLADATLVNMMTTIPEAVFKGTMVVSSGAMSQSQT